MVVQQSDLARALFGALKEQMGHAVAGGGSGALKAAEAGPFHPGETAAGVLPGDDALAEAAVAMEQIIRRHAVVRWRENTDAQNRMKNDLDDFLYELQQQRGLSLNFTQMDAIIDAVLRIARHRPDDV
jgi:type I restriction enzyme R subunit